MLQAVGDPRGELMALQLLPPDDDGAIPRQARIQALLERHHREWLGWVREIAGSVRFQRGMLTRMHLSARFGVGDPRWENVFADPALASVEDVLGQGADYARFIQSPALVSLRRIELHDELAVRAFEAMSRPIAHIACPQYYEQDLPLLRRALARCVEMATTSIAVMGTLFWMVRATPWFQRLTAITVGAGVRNGLALWSQLPRPMALTIVPFARLDPCSRVFPWDYRVEIVPTADGLLARLSGEWLLQHMSTLDLLPAGIVRVEIEETSDGIAARLAEALKHRRFEVVAYAARRHGYLQLS